ncbi:MAG TPA: YgaP-like transmembrane domain [Thermoanaerobaculia bacterium]|nr:YgaP-like transmembrane domain [Thermoanaerobaculia bacterium]
MKDRIFNRVGSRLGGKSLNVGKMERWASVLGGAALAAYALKRRGRGGMGLALAGAPLLWRGATGHCAVYEKMGIDRVHGTALAPRDLSPSNTTSAFSSPASTSTSALSEDAAVHGNEREFLGTASGVTRPASEQF